MVIPHTIPERPEWWKIFLPLEIECRSCRRRFRPSLALLMEHLSHLTTDVVEAHDPEAGRILDEAKEVDIREMLAEWSLRDFLDNLDFCAPCSGEESYAGEFPERDEKKEVV